ncbi:MAG: hypothetical protein HY078_13890 [Elusimicrobia bacterium]|nr:hypothetical protein [Elusimicrobiota bacterium]
MWVLARLLLAAGTFLLKLRYRASLPAARGAFRGRPYFVRVDRNKGRIVRRELGMRLTTPVVFRMHPERLWDRFFKALGFIDELQTGDEEFDRRVYVVCDHPLLAVTLMGSPDARAKIREAADMGFPIVYSDGNALWLRTDSKLKDGADERELEVLADLTKSLRSLEAELTNQFVDPFLWRALVVESAVWSIAAYAIGAFIEVAFAYEDIHVAPTSLIFPGLILAGMLLSALVVAIPFVLGRSSRAHRVLVECGIILIVCGAPAGIQLASDVNRTLDTSESVVADRTVERKEKREHRGSRGGRWYSYHLHFADSEMPQGIPRNFSVAVARSTYDSAREGGAVRFTIGRGWLRRPWYRAIEPR